MDDYVAKRQAWGAGTWGGVGVVPRQKHYQLERLYSAGAAVGGQR